jgi:hypothetical protein
MVCCAKSWKKTTDYCRETTIDVSDVTQSGRQPLTHWRARRGLTAMSALSWKALDFSQSQIRLQTGGDCRPQKLTHASSRVADFCHTNIASLNGFYRNRRAVAIRRFCHIGPLTKQKQENDGRYRNAETPK